MAKRELPEQHKQVLNNPSLGKIERMREVKRINDLGYSQQVNSEKTDEAETDTDEDEESEEI